MFTDGIWHLNHQKKMKVTLDQIELAGQSTLEDLPDLICPTAGLVSGIKGFSNRVIEMQNTIKNLQINQKTGLWSMPDDVISVIYAHVHKIKLHDVIQEMRLMFKCVFNTEDWSSCFGRHGGMIFAQLSRLSWSISADEITDGLQDVTETFNQAWRSYEWLCTVAIE